MSQPHRPDDAVLADEPRRHAVVWIVYALLYAVAIPWYWPAGFRGPLVLGLPAWVAVSLGSVVLLTVWTGFVIHRWWPDAELPGVEEAEDG